MTTAIRPLTVTAGDWRRRPQPHTQSWEDRAACYNRPESWWDGEKPAEAGRARQICLSCPVLEQCLTQRMRDEGKVLWARHGIRGALPGPQRTQLFLDEREGGPYDAEEARLLALEAGEMRMSAADVAGEGAPGVTVRLAQRMAGEAVPAVKLPVGLELRKGIALQRAWDRVEDIARLRESGVSIALIAARVHVGRNAISEVVRSLEGMATASGKGAAA